MISEVLIQPAETAETASETHQHLLNVYITWFLNKRFDKVVLYFDLERFFAPARVRVCNSCGVLMIFMKRFPYKILVPLAIFLGLAPFLPQPHLVEKIEMLANGSLRKPIDIFDFFWHVWPVLLLVVKVVSDLRTRK